MGSGALLAIFTGGRSSRMGRPKGRLQVPGSTLTIIEHAAACGRALDLRPVLVGEASAYADLVIDLPRLPDEPANAGPLGGLQAALRYARAQQLPQVLCVACDMPFLSEDALRTLRDYADPSPVVAPRRSPDAPWEPMLARYEVAPSLPELRASLDAGLRSFQKLFSRLEVAALPLTPELERALQDWDEPSDLQS